jgi:hypothetical protein
LRVKGKVVFRIHRGERCWSNSSWRLHRLSENASPVASIPRLRDQDDSERARNNSIHAQRGPLSDLFRDGEQLAVAAARQAVGFLVGYHLFGLRPKLSLLLSLEFVRQGRGIVQLT